MLSGYSLDPLVGLLLECNLEDVLLEENGGKFKISAPCIHQDSAGCTQRAVTVDEETKRTKTESCQIISKSSVEQTPKTHDLSKD